MSMEGIIVRVVDIQVVLVLVGTSAGLEVVDMLIGLVVVNMPIGQVAVNSLLVLILASPLLGNHKGYLRELHLVLVRLLVAYQREEHC